MILAKHLSDEKIKLAFLNNFAGYSRAVRKRLMSEHVKRTLKMLDVKEKYKLIPDKDVFQFSCDDHKRIIRYNPAFVDSGPSHPGVYAYLLICHECIHAKQNEKIREIEKGREKVDAVYLNQLSLMMPANSWTSCPSCGYISPICIDAFSPRDETLRNLIMQIYRLQPSEYEAYKFQYESAIRLKDFVAKNRSKLINSSFVTSKILFEIHGFELTLLNAATAFETEEPVREINKALWEMRNSQEPNNYIQALFQAGTVMTYGLFKDNLAIDRALSLINDIERYKEKTPSKNILLKKDKLKISKNYEQKDYNLRKHNKKDYEIEK